MKIHFGGRLFLVAAVFGAVAVLVLGLLVALGVHSVVAGPGSAPAAGAPTPVGHAWTELEGHGTGTGLWWLGTTASNALELRVNNARALRLEPNATSPNVIGGYSGNSVTAGALGAAVCGGGSGGGINSVTDDYGTVGGGSLNRAGDNAGTTSDKTYATVAGGRNDTASGQYATVGGGEYNTASGAEATIAGGVSNNATGSDSSIGGGMQNIASQQYATVAGGRSGSANGQFATVGGGEFNAAGGARATVGGGGYNIASGQYSNVPGGNSNMASGGYSTVPGGSSNTAQGNYSFAAGRRAKANHQGAFVWADSTDADFASTTADQFLVRASGGVGLNVTSGGLRLESNATSPNVIGGYSADTVTSGAFGATISGGGASGSANRVTDNYGTVGGGGNNQAGDGAGTTGDKTNATVGGGSGNTASGNFSTVDGGLNSAANATYATVGGGYANTASGYAATIGGGSSSTASGSDATVGGGNTNTASGNYSTIPGGYGNTAQGTYSFAAGRRAKANHQGAFVWADSTDADFASTTADQFLVRASGGVSLNVTSGGLRLESNATSPNVIGGYSGNTLTAGTFGATISGGGFAANVNTVTDNFSMVGGGSNNRAGDNLGTTGDAQYATVGGGSGNTASALYATVGGGVGNDVTDNSGTVGGGVSNQAGLDDGIPMAQSYATVAGGSSNLASGNYSTIGGGDINTASASRATVGGGSSNLVTDNYGTVCGGYDNQAGNNLDPTTDRTYATVGGGNGNIASGQYSTVPGGSSNTAAGDYSFAAGRQTSANHAGAFVWGDSMGGPYASQRADQFRARANGGARFDVNNNRSVEIYDQAKYATNILIDTSVGAYLTTAGAWTNASDREMKENFTPVDGQQVLASLAEMPISTWNSKAEDPAIRHMGPVAQDFYAAFDLGASDTSIGTLDADGVALAAIQGLYELSQDQAARIDALEEENASLQQRVDDLEARVSAVEGGAPLERGSESLLSSIVPGGWLILIGLLVVVGLVLAQRRRAGGRR